MNRLKQKNDMIISVDEKIIFDKMYYPFMILKNIEEKARIILNLIKGNYQNLL